MTYNLNVTSGNNSTKINLATGDTRPYSDGKIPEIGLQHDVFTKTPEPLKDETGKPVMLADNGTRKTDAKCDHGFSQAVLGLMYGQDKVTDNMLEQRKQALDKGCQIRQNEEEAEAKAKSDKKRNTADLDAKKKATGYEENGTWGFMKKDMVCQKDGKYFSCKPECTFNTKTNSGEQVSPRQMMKDLGYNENEYTYANTEANGIQKYAVVKRTDINN